VSYAFTDERNHSCNNVRNKLADVPDLRHLD